MSWIKILRAVAQPSEEMKTQTKDWILSSLKTG